MSATAAAMPMPDAEQPLVAEPAGFLRRLLRQPVAVVCVGYLTLVVVIAVVAPILLPGVASENAGQLLSARQGPGAGHLLGTDALGRDVLERLLVGARVTVVGVAEALVVALAVGVPLGLAAGFAGGRIDRVVSWLADLAFSMPAIVIVLVVLAVFPQSMTAAMVTFGLIASPALMRVVRSATLPVRGELYVAAAQVAGLSRSYIVIHHVLPRIAGVVIVQASLVAAQALLVQTGLAFLKLVVAPPAPSWGGMVADGVEAIVVQPWLIWPPGIVIAATILALGLLGDAVRDATNEAWSRPVRRERSRGRHRGVAAATRPPAVPAAPGTVLSVEGLSVAIETAGRQMTLVEDVGFTIRAGETVALVGESGCGKSITAMSLLGLLPSGAAITTGRVVLDGRELTGLHDAELRRVRGSEIGLISQEPMIGLNPALRIGGQLAEVVRRHKGVTRSVARERAIELLRQVHLPMPDAVVRRYPHELSGGMAQRVAIARALAGDPRLLIADEPTTALDVTVQAEILELLRELQAQRGMAILLVTHDWGVVAEACERAIVMYAGQVVERADVTAIFREPLHPYSQGLLCSNPHSAAPGEALPMIRGSVPQPHAWPAGCRFAPRCEHAVVACRERPVPLTELGAGRATRCIRHEELRTR
jgi:peptide/nickel transport system permease protein